MAAVQLYLDTHCLHSAGQERHLLVAFSAGPYGAALADGSEYDGSYADRVTEEQLMDFHAKRLHVSSIPLTTPRFWRPQSSSLLHRAESRHSLWWPALKACLEADESAIWRDGPLCTRYADKGCSAGSGWRGSPGCCGLRDSALPEGAEGNLAAHAHGVSRDACVGVLQLQGR